MANVTTRGTKNVLLTPNVIAKEMLMRLMNALVLPKLGRFDYGKYFEDAIGNTITIKKPYFAFVSSGRALTAAQINPMVDESIEISVDKRYKGALKWNDVELTLDINQFSERYLDTIIEQLGYRFDQDGAIALINGAFMIAQDPGTVLTQDQVPDIRAYWNEAGIPMDGNNFGLINPVDSAQIQKDLAGAAGNSGKFNEAIVKRNIERWFRGELSGFRMFESIHIPDLDVRYNHTGTPLVMGANQNGDSIVTDGWGVNATKVLNKGQLIKIANVKQTYPRSWKEDLSAKIPIGRDMVFTVLEDVTTGAAGQATIRISPEINDGTLTTLDGDGNDVTLKAFQNVTQEPADNAAITIVGLASPNPAAVKYRQNIFFHRRALHFVPVMLAELKSAVHQYTAVDPQTNLSVAALQYLDGANREETLRLDSFYGVKNIYGDLCVRYASSVRP